MTPQPFTDSSERIFILPFGFVQSPIIASLCLSKSKLGEILAKADKHHDMSVSVYFDDIIISGDDVVLLHDVLKKIKSAAERSSFFLNDKKEEGPSAKITVFNIELSSQILEVTKDSLSEFEAAYIQSDNDFQKKKAYTLMWLVLVFLRP